MLAGLNREERAKLNLEGFSPSNLRYLQGGDVKQDEHEDAARFQAWKACLGILGIPFLDVVRVLAAVLLLGNVQFVDGQVRITFMFGNSFYDPNFIVRYLVDLKKFFLCSLKELPSNLNPNVNSLIA